jgi:hypothetical protein
MMVRVFSPAVRVAAVEAFLLAAAGCQGGEVTHPPSDPPMRPTVEPGMATLQGRVLDLDGRPIAGATVSVLQAPASEDVRTATSSATGTWELTIPGDWTVTLKAEAGATFAPTLSNAVAVPKDGTSAELDLLMVTPAQVDQLNMMGGMRPNDYGVVALEVVSLSGGCVPTGGTVSIDPAPLGKVMYSRAKDSMPDDSLTAMQAGVRPAAWVLGALPPGTYYRFRFDKAGCSAAPAPVTYKGRSYDGTLTIGAKTLSHGLLFVQ